MFKEKQVMEILEQVKQLVKNEEFIVKHKIKNRSFIRNRMLSFSTIVLFIMTLPKNGLPFELEKFFEKHLDKEKTVSKQGFSKARQFISEKAFYELFEITSDIKIEEPKLFKGHFVYAIDGSALQLPDTKENRAYFGEQTNNSTPLAMAKLSNCYDVLNDLVHNVTTNRRTSSSP
ncbi:MAG: hypothetical protein ACK5LY_00695 [Lachnospirales bacterium]